MAIASMTMLQALNKITRNVRTGRITSIPSSWDDPCNEADAREILGQVIQEFVIAGKVGKITRHFAITCSGGIADLSSRANLVYVRMRGKYEGIDVVLIDGVIYNPNSEGGTTACFTGSEVIYVDLHEHVDTFRTDACFTKLDPSHQMLVVAEAARRVLIANSPDQVKDAALSRQADQFRDAAIDGQKRPPTGEQPFRGVSFDPITGGQQRGGMGPQL